MDSQTLQPKPELHQILRWGALLCILVGALLPASAGVELVPFWDFDPTTQWTPMTGIQPVLMLLLALLSVAGAVVAIGAEYLSGKRILWGQAVLAGVGSLGVLAHGSLDSLLHGDATGAMDGIEHLVRAAPWIAMVWGWVGMAHLCRDARTRAVVLAVLAGFLVMLLIKGLVQVYFEHALTVAEFERTKSDILAANGWTPGSPAALVYERRLMQPEAAGWFGLSNVYASFVGAGLAGLIAAGSAVVLRTRRIGRGVVLCAAIGLCGAAALLLSKSKGGIGAVGIGLGVCACLGFLGQYKPGLMKIAASWAGPAVIAGVLGVVAVRGLVGPELGERSLLFRGFYAVGSLRIWSDFPIFGVGPDGFQDAYAAAKIPIATETVQSPHSVLLDWTSTLGIFGLAWAALLIWQSTRLLNIDDEPEIIEPENPKSLDRDAVRFVVLLVAAVGLSAAGIERALATPLLAGARVVGLGGWIAAAIGMLWIFRSHTAVRWFGPASGLALIAHAQIEVTPVWINGAPLLGVWFGAVMTGGAQTRKIQVAVAPSRRRIAAIGSLAALAVSCGALIVPIGPVRIWQDSLTRAAEIVRPGAELRAEFERTLEARDRAGIAMLAGRLSEITGTVVPGRPDSVAAALQAARLMSLEAALGPLADAVEARPGNKATTAAYLKIVLDLAANEREYLDAALRLDSIRGRLDPSHKRPRSVGLWDLGAMTMERIATILDTRSERSTPNLVREQARSLWLGVDERSPYSVRPAVHLMDLSVALGADEDARRWAGEALRRDGLKTLDPISGLTGAEHARATRILAGG